MTTLKKPVCELCGELFKFTDQKAEMYDPTWSEEISSLIVHAECGLNQGLVIA